MLLKKFKLTPREINLAAFALAFMAMTCGLTASAALRSTDHWAAISAIGTLIGAVLGFVGILLTAWIAWKSYKTADTATQIAKRAMSADRAWMVIQKPKAKYGDSSGMLHAMMGPSISVDIPLKNFGNSPALRVEVSVQKGYQELGIELPPVYSDVGTPRNFAAIVPQGTEVVNHTISGDMMPDFLSRKFIATFLVAVTYDDVFSDNERRLFKAEYYVLCWREDKVLVMNSGVAQIT